MTLKRILAAALANVFVAIVPVSAQVTIWSGRITVPDGRAVSGVTVSLIRAGTVATVVTTNEGGTFEFVADVPEADEVALNLAAGTLGGGLVAIDPHRPYQVLQVGNLRVELTIVSSQGGPPSPPSPPPPAPPQRPNILLSGWDFYPPDESEAPGFGLYSYLLIRDKARPGTPLHELHVATVDALRAQMSPIAEMRVRRSPLELNITYIPIQRAPPGSVAAAVILDAYDYTRARNLLPAISEATGPGPYLVSVVAPLGDGRVQPQRVLKQDLSGIPPRMAYLLVRTFIRQAGEPQEWGSRGLERFVVRFRAEIAREADSFPEVQAGTARLGDVEMSVNVTPMSIHTALFLPRT